MADVHTKETRSKNMAAIKGKNTKPEIPVRKIFYMHMATGTGYTIKNYLKILPRFMSYFSARKFSGLSQGIKCSLRGSSCYQLFVYLITIYLNCSNPCLISWSVLN
jgi:DNA mismatch endonuclease Vsr